MTRATNAADARATAAIADASALSKQTAAAAAKLVRRMQSKYAKKAMAARAREGALAGLNAEELALKSKEVQAQARSVVRGDLAKEAAFRVKVMDAVTPRLERMIDMLPRTPDGTYVDPRSALCLTDDAVNLFNYSVAPLKNKFPLSFTLVSKQMGYQLNLTQLAHAGHLMREKVAPDGKHHQYVDGRVTLVNTYNENHLDAMKQAIRFVAERNKLPVFSDEDLEPTYF